MKKLILGTLASMTIATASFAQSYDDDPSPLAPLEQAADEIGMTQAEQSMGLLPYYHDNYGSGYLDYFYYYNNYTPNYRYYPQQ